MPCGVRNTVNNRSFDSKFLPASREELASLRMTKLMTLPLRHHFCRNSLGHESLDHIPGFDIAVVGDRDAALHAIGDLACVVFEPAQRANLTLEDDDVVAQESHFGVALDQAIRHAAPSDCAHLRDPERL